jgi:CheY-like chemotaxis protein
MPNLVLLDMNMPGMGGLETCRAMRAGSDTPVIILSVRNTREGQGGRARCRRRRLRHQAVRHRRTAGAHPRRAAPFALVAGRRSARVSLAGLEIDFDARRVRARAKSA